MMESVVFLGKFFVVDDRSFKAFDGEVRASLRSSGRVNVQAAAARLGGGGHFRASGLTYPGTLAEAIAGVDAALVAEGL